MRIQASGTGSAVGKSNKTARSGRSGAVFSLDEQEDASPTGSASAFSSVMPVGDISALLAVQGVHPDQQRSQAVLNGYDTLDALDALKIDVLSGQVSRQKLLSLASLVDKERAKTSDPALQNVLDHIELRARVELAKFEQKCR